MPSESPIKLLLIRFLYVCALYAVLLPQVRVLQAHANVETPVIAFAARLIGDDQRARLIVDFDRKITHDLMLIDDPKRIIVALPETIFSLPKDIQTLPKSMVGLIRYGTTAPGQSRMVLELNRAARVERSRLRALSDSNRFRLIIDIIPTTEARFAQLSRKSDSVVKGASKSTAPQRKFKIVLDPGHGGIDGGAEGKGRTSEKTVTLNFAKKLRNELMTDGRYTVLMTRDQDVFVSLSKRLALARDSKADLFISIHADSLAQAGIRGATVYTLNEDGSDALSRVLARKQNRADLIAGLSLPETKPSVTDILIELTRRETEVFSIRFAKLMIQKLRNQVRLINNPHRSADFYVLKAPEVPSVLLELGYLSNAEDEALMKNPQWQEKAVRYTVEAVHEFFLPRLARQQP